MKKFISLLVCGLALISVASYTTINGGEEWTYSQVSGSDATTTSTTGANITGLTFAAAASTTYEIEAILYVSTTADVTGVKYYIAYSGSGAPTCKVILTGAVTSATAGTAYTDATNTPSATTFLTTTSETGVVIIKGIVVSGAGAGNITIAHLKVTSGTSTVKIGSVMKVRKL
jgi:hypothetical protein